MSSCSPLTTRPMGQHLRKLSEKEERRFPGGKGALPLGAPDPGKSSREGGTCCAWSPGEPPVGVNLHSAVPKVTNISLLHAAATLAISLFTGRLDRFGEQQGIPGRFSDGAQGSLCGEELSQKTEISRRGERS